MFVKSLGRSVNIESKISVIILDKKGLSVSGPKYWSKLPMFCILLGGKCMWYVRRTKRGSKCILDEMSLGRNVLLAEESMYYIVYNNAGEIRPKQLSRSVSDGKKLGRDVLGRSVSKTIGPKWPAFWTETSEPKSLWAEVSDIHVKWNIQIWCWYGRLWWCPLFRVPWDASI